METGNFLEPNEGWAVRGEELVRLQHLLELARQAHRTELSQEKRDEIRERVLARLDAVEARRRRVRVVVAAVSGALLAGLVLTFVVSRGARRSLLGAR